MLSLHRALFWGKESNIQITVALRFPDAILDLTEKVPRFPSSNRCSPCIKCGSRFAETKHTNLLFIFNVQFDKAIEISEFSTTWSLVT